MDHITLRAPSRNEMTIAGLLLIFRRRRKVIAVTTAVCFLLGVAVCLFTTRRYQAKTVIEIQKSSADMLGLQNIMPNGSEGPGDALNANLDLQTESEVLQSDTLALKVIQKLHLDKTRDFQSHWNPLGWALGVISPSGPSDGTVTSLENAPQHRTHAVRVFENHLKVKPVPGTRLIEISYLHTDPKVAAAVVNDLVGALKDYGFQTRYAATNESSAWLSGQLADLKKQTQDLQAKVESLQKYSGVYSLGMDSQGHDQVYSGTLDQLQQATTALTEATSNRITKGAVYQTVKNGDPELISGLAGAGLMGASSAVQSSFNLLQTLRGQQATLQSQLAQDSSKFGSNYPKLVDERSSLRSVNKAIADEIGRIGKRAANDYKAAQTAEDSLQGVYNQRKAKAEKLNDKAIEYGIAKQEADDSRNLYEDLFKKLKEAGVMEGLRSSNITIVEPGRAPGRPARPNVPVYLGVSLFAGLFFGVCGALFSDVIDDKIQSYESVEKLLDAPLMGVLPMFRKPPQFSIPARKWLSSGDSEKPLARMDGPATAFAEALRSLRTKLLLSRSAAAPKVILVTSAVPGEGKSTVSANLSGLLARSGKRVLLVEADMRSPTFSQRFDSPEISPGGLSVLLSDDQVELEDDAIEGASGVWVLQAGPIPPFPAELLDSERMRNLLENWKLQFDHIVLDSPPLLAVTDGTVLSKLADVTLLIARPGLTSRTALKRAYKLIEEDGDTRVALVLNAVDRNSASYSDYYGYAGSSYYVKEGTHG